LRVPAEHDTFPNPPSGAHASQPFGHSVAPESAQYGVWGLLVVTAKLAAPTVLRFAPGTLSGSGTRSKLKPHDATKLCTPELATASAVAEALADGVDDGVCAGVPGAVGVGVGVALGVEPGGTHAISSAEPSAPGGAASVPPPTPTVVLTSAAGKVVFTNDEPPPPPPHAK